MKDEKASPVAFLAWTERTARADEIAASLGGVSRRFNGRLPNRPSTAALRYLVNTAETLWWLVTRRPRALIVQNPPIVLPLVAWAWGKIARIPVVLDSHPASFGRKDSRVWAFFLPLHRWLARRSAAVLVTVDALAGEVQDWGARSIVIHEAPAAGGGAAAGAPELDAVPSRVLFVGVFASDEPVQAVIDAAALVPNVEIHITGRLTDAPRGAVEAAPPNVRFVGFLEAAAYTRAVAEAGTVMALTTESTSVVRAGYEAVYAGRPLIVSDWPTLRELFPYAVYTGHSAEALATAMGEGVERNAELVARAADARGRQLARWEEQRRALGSIVLSGGAGAAPGEPSLDVAGTPAQALRRVGRGRYR
jgi:glycosyltransferase involved in cell wall biosynthesis